MHHPIFLPATVALALGLLLSGGNQALAAERPPPSTAFDLGEWKLQIPGPKDVKNLEGYASEYFDLNGDGEMCFRLDAADKGTTENTRYVRSELRHLPNWRVNETRTLSAVLRAVSRLKPDKLTVLQIHGMKDDGGNAPPLLRVALQSGDLVALLKIDREGKKEEKVSLMKGLGDGLVTLQITVQAGQLGISVNGSEIARRDLSFWPYLNYFKAGCYPQATKGTAEVMFRQLSVQ
jgi:hypothetical protein